MKDICFFNVGHGESILIRYPEVQIIRDFGRSKYAKETPFSCSIEKLAYRFKKYCTSIPETIAILSHLHEDHCNGFFELYNQKDEGIKFFKKTFIPWLKFDDIKAIGSFILRINLFLTRLYFKTSHQNSNRPQKILKIIPVLFDLSEELYCVGKGHSFNEIPDVNNVYWPPVDKHQTIEQSDWDDFNHIIERCFNKEHIEGFAADAQSLAGLIKNLLNGENSHSNINSIIDYIGDIIRKPIDNRPFQNDIEKVKLMSSKYIDNNSIIFDILPKDNCGTLFLSDADENSVYQALKNYTSRQYQFIKAGHHGTRGAKSLQKLNYKADEVICCCGPALNSWYGPSRDYLNIGKVYCTDWNDKSHKWINKDLYSFKEKCFIYRKLK